MTVLQALRCSSSIQVEIVEHINEIAIRDEKARADIVETPEAGEILASKELNHRRKTQALRDFLAGLRYPRFSARQKASCGTLNPLGCRPGKDHPSSGLRRQQLENRIELCGTRRASKNSRLGRRPCRIRPHGNNFQASGAVEARLRRNL